MMPAAPACLRKSRRLTDFSRGNLHSSIPVSNAACSRGTNKKAFSRGGNFHLQMNALALAATAIGRDSIRYYAIVMPTFAIPVLFEQEQGLSISSAARRLAFESSAMHSCGAA
jgi:hypothetical protein